MIFFISKPWNSHLSVDFCLVMGLTEIPYYNIHLHINSLHLQGQLHRLQPDAVITNKEDWVWVPCRPFNQAEASIMK